jgi:6-phosphogluconolactonase
MSHRLIFTNNTYLNNTNYISGSGVGAVNASNRRALKRRSNVNATTSKKCCDEFVKIDRYFAYVANSGNNANGNSVNSYEINSSTGILTLTGTVKTDTPSGSGGTAPQSIAIHPTKKFAYVANVGSGILGVITYIINQLTGTLTYASSIDTTTGLNEQPFSVAIDPTGRFAYVNNFNVNIISAFTINQTTGALTLIANYTGVSSKPHTITVHPNGKFVYLTNYQNHLVSTLGNTISAFTINQTTGALSLINTYATGTQPNVITIHPSGNYVYTVNFGSSITGYPIDQTTGALGTRFDIVFPVSGSQPRSITFDPTGRFAYVANYNQIVVRALKFDQTNGALTPIGTVSSIGTNPVSVSVDPTGKYVYVVNFNAPTGSPTAYGSAYIINQTTGALSALSPVNFTTGSTPSYVITTLISA